MTTQMEQSIYSVLDHIRLDMLDHIRFGSQRVNSGAVAVVRYDKGSLNGQKMNNRQKIDKKTRKK